MWSTYNVALVDFNAKIKLWTRIGEIKDNLRKGINVRRFDALLANAILNVI